LVCGFSIGLNDVRPITSNADSNSALGRYRSLIATQMKIRVRATALRKSGEVSGAAASAIRGTREATVSCALTSGGWIVASIVRAVSAALVPGRTA